MPNRIFAIMVDSVVNPANIKKQAAKKQEQKVSSHKQANFSKEASEASKAYASAKITRHEPEHYSEIRLLDEGLKAKKHAKDIYAYSCEMLRTINGKELLQEARRNDFKHVYDEDSDIETAYEYKKRHGKKPDVLMIYKYDDCELYRKITLKDNGIYVSSIVFYSAKGFEEFKFTQGSSKESVLYEYSQGENTPNGTVINKQYRYDTKNSGQIKEFKKGVRQDETGAITTDLIINYDKNGKCKSAQEHIVADKYGNNVSADSEVEFKSENNFYIINVNS